MNLYYSTQKQFMDFLDSLSFEQKQKIVEAVISPENGGKITVSENVEGGVDIEIDFQLISIGLRTLLQILMIGKDFYDIILIEIDNYIIS